jgi:hypothetical protein
VLIPEIVKTRWYQHILHPSHATYLRRQLLRYGGARITVMSVPWNLDELDASREGRAGRVNTNGQTGSGGGPAKKP